MKVCSLIGLVVVCALLSGAASAQLPTSAIVSLDEFGNGTLNVDPLFVGPIPWAIGPDIGPTGAPNALLYLVPQGYTNPFVTGDVLIFEPGQPDVVSDILRFNPNGTIAVYSDNTEGADSPADLGFPEILWDNQVRAFETGDEFNSWLDYTPGPDMPGYVFATVAPIDVTYHFVSDAGSPPIPEFPAPLLAAIGGIGGFIWRRRK